MKIGKLLIAACLGLLPTLGVAAHDFQAVAPGGQTLYFNIVEGTAVLTYPADVVQPINGWAGYARPTGDLTIPATVTAPNGTVYPVAAVGSYALYGCSGLTSVTLADGIASVRSNAFHNCSAVATLDLPTSLDTIGTAAFKYCTALEEVRIFRPTPPATQTTAFNEVNLSQCTLIVSCQGAASYSAVAPWNLFGTIVDTGCVATLLAVSNYASRGSVAGGGTYSLGTSVVLTATPAAGFFFACWSDGDTLNPRVLTLYGDLQLTAHFFAYRHDTVNGAGVDTVYVIQQHNDTIRDTIYQQGPQPTFYHLTVVSGDSWRGVASGSCTVPAGTEIEICGLATEGYAFAGWLDGPTDNPRRVQVTGDQTYTALFCTASVTVVDAASAWTASVSGRLLTVGCRVGQRLRLFDMQGRCLLTTTATADRTHLLLPAAGAYLVQVDDGPARRVVAE